MMRTRSGKRPSTYFKKKLVSLWSLGPKYGAIVIASKIDTSWVLLSVGFSFDARKMCRLSRKWNEVEHYSTYHSAGHVL